MIIIKTYQDLVKVLEKNNDDDLSHFLESTINEYKTTDDYRWALIGDAYDRQENTTIMSYRKMLYTMSGKAVPDYFSAQHKLASNFYNRFNIQENQYLLGNGVTFNDPATKDKLGKGLKAFDTMIQKLGKYALTHGCAYGLWNLDHIDIFKRTEFAPLVDEEDGAIKAGVRFWQIDENKPLRATLYEISGYTEYIRRKTDAHLNVLKEKRPYILKVRVSEADGAEIYDGENYPSFPVVPLWGNQDHTCKIKAWQSKIDCYDLIESGFANDVDDASLIYWTINNAGGMDEVDLAQFLQRMKTVHASVIDEDGASAEAHTIDVPVTARETYLTRLENDLYKDCMALDTNAIASGSATATAIRASYEPLNAKTNDFEYCVTEFIQNILALAGIEDDPTFTRSTIVNQTEETAMVLSASQYLDDETILHLLPFINVDMIDGILDRKTREEATRFEPDATEEDVNGPSEEENR